MFRLKQKHSTELGAPRRKIDGRAILNAQSLRNACIAAAVATVLLNVVWMLSADLLNRVFPWFVIVQGVLIGLAVRRWGRGLDWRFATLAALVTIVAAYGGNFLLAAGTTADEFGTGPLKIVSNISQWTLGVYFDEVVSPVDHIYALYAAALAAFLAKRRLTRAQSHAVRTLQERESAK